MERVYRNIINFIEMCIVKPLPAPFVHRSFGINTQIGQTICNLHIVFTGSPRRALILEAGRGQKLFFNY